MEPEVKRVDPEDEILMGSEEDQKIGREEPTVVDAAAVQALQTKAMIDVASAVKQLVERQEAVRQIPYNEIKPVTPWNPEGKRDRLKLKNEVFQHGYWLNPIMMTEKTIGLFNQLKPGRYFGRKIEVSRKHDGTLNITWSNAKIEQRMEFAMKFPHIDDILEYIINERKEKEEKRRSGKVDEEEFLS